MINLWIYIIFNEKIKKAQRINAWKLDPGQIDYALEASPDVLGSVAPACCWHEADFGRHCRDIIVEIHLKLNVRK
jgi:hypothetical protein